MSIFTVPNGDILIVDVTVFPENIVKAMLGF